MSKTITKIHQMNTGADEWLCDCGNTATHDGFYPCDEQGKEREPTEGWNGLYVCDRCKKVYKQGFKEPNKMKIKTQSAMFDVNLAVGKEIEHTHELLPNEIPLILTSNEGEKLYALVQVSNLLTVIAGHVTKL